ncbi:MAG: MFS transporter, partial [Propionibacterium sp.]|nr:MFS transporter [Propionibacterium sp.]
MTGRLWGRVRRDRGGESLLGDRDYLAWFAADTSWAFGTGVRSFAMLLVSFAVTGSAAQAGLISTVSTVCALVATVPGGVLVDRWDRRTSLITSGILRLVLCLLAALTWEMGAMDTAVLYVVGIGLGVVSGLFGTASDAALKSVVTGAQLPQAVSANQGRDGAVSLVASPISGALMAVSNALPFAVAAGAALIQVVATRVIRADLRPIDDE